VTAGSGVLAITLEVAVPMHLAEVRGLPFAERHRIAQEAASVTGSQGDVLQYGGGPRFGHGTRELAGHLSGPRCTVKDCRCHGEGCASQKCYCHVRGEPSYSAGEVFNHLARGLAVLACQPGGVTFAGRHWCAWTHPGCPRRPGQGPECSCPPAAWLVNGCRQAIDGQCSGSETTPGVSDARPVRSVDLVAFDPRRVGL
jgi:hypothetical protein